MKVFENFYFFNSRILTHGIFWIIYYIVFSYIWTDSNNYYDSFYLEFILLPIRIFAVYFTIYLLLPNLLLKAKYMQFFALFAVVLLFAGVLQRLFIHFFYEKLLQNNQEDLFSLSSILRAVILINSTVLLVMSFKIFKEWNKVHAKYKAISNVKIRIRANKRIYNLSSNEILYLEGLGNYVTFHTTGGKKLITHLSLKKSLDILPNNFLRIHKSYIINKDHVNSYNFEDIEINNHKLPVGKHFDISLLNSY